jgi:hypothetical protein
MELSPWFSFVLAVVTGALVWLLSPLLYGQREPWDADWPYYPASLSVAGFLPGCVAGRWFLLCPIGVLFGQALVFLVLVAQTPGPLWLVGLFVLVTDSLRWGLLGAGLGASLHWFARRAYRALFSSPVS